MKPKRTITQAEKQYLLSLKPDDITLDLLHDLFTDRYDTKTNKIIPSKFNTYDEFSLKRNEFINREDIPVTNCGLFIVNKFLIEPELSTRLDYQNVPMDKKQIENIKNKIDTLLMEDDITPEVYINYLNRLTWLSFTFNTEITTSLTVSSMKELPEVKKKKEELKKKYKDDLESDDNNRATVAATNMEKELIDVAKKALENDPAIDLYNSGARGAFNVAYKNSQIMKGPVYNESKHKYDIMYEPIASGIKKENVPTLANSVVANSYSTAIATGDCGYKTKKLNAVFQSSVLGKRGSDCKSAGYNEVEINKDTYNLYSYGFIVEGSKLVRLDSKTKDKYMGKTVKMRSIAYCTSKNPCNMCAGDKYYLLGQQYIGLTTGKISNQLMQRRLKAKHDSTVSSYSININEDFL